MEKDIADATYYAVAEQGVFMKDVMTMVDRHLQLPVKGKPLSEALEAIGFLDHMIGSNNPSSSEKTQRKLR